MLLLMNKGEILRLLAHVGQTATCGNSISSLCTAARHRAARAAGTALNPRRIRSAESALCGGIDATLALPYTVRSVIGSYSAGDRNAARRLNQPENRSCADPGSHAKIRSDRADDVAVVPADAYEYRHELNVAQP